MYLFHAEIPISFLYARFFKTNMVDGKRKVVECESDYCYVS